MWLSQSIVLAHLSCYNKILQTRQLIDNRNSLLIVLEAGKFKIKASVWSGEGPLPAPSQFLLMYSHGKSRGCLWSLFYKAIFPFMRGPPSQYYPMWWSGFQPMNFGQTHSDQSTIKWISQFVNVWQTLVWKTAQEHIGFFKWIIFFLQGMQGHGEMGGLIYCLSLYNHFPQWEIRLAVLKGN